jgi:L-threonylcarbamoyladenylate synthase
LKTTDKIIPVDAVHPAAASIEQASDVIRSGGVVILPTSGLYGLGADALNPNAVERLFRLKGRDRSRPILVLIAGSGTLLQLTGPLNPATHSMMAHFWPGRVTFVVSARAGLPFGLTGGSGKIGVRLVAHPVARALVRRVASPLTGTSANLSGAGGCAAIAEIDPAVINAVDLVLDSGPLSGGPGSTVVDLTADKPVILREGVVAADEIRAVFAQLRDGESPSVA